MNRNILVAYDDSELSVKAVEEALAQANALKDVNVYIIAVFSPSGLGTSYPGMTENVEQEMMEEVKVKLDDITKEFAEEKVQVSTEVFVDNSLRNVGRVIVEYAEENNMDMIIVGSRSLGGVKGTILGSVSSQVVQHAPCHVMIVK